MQLHVASVAYAFEVDLEPNLGVLSCHRRADGVGVHLACCGMLRVLCCVLASRLRTQQNDHIGDDALKALLSIC